MTLALDRRAAMFVLFTLVACGGRPDEPDDPDDEPDVCWSWRANVGMTILPAPAALDGERVLLANAGLLRFDPSGWRVERATPGIFAIMRGPDWTALAVRGEAGETDWLDFQRDGEDWTRVEPPVSLLGRRWESTTHDDRAVYVRASSGAIVRFDGERWEQVAAAVESNNARLTVAGDVLYDWHNGSLDIYEDGAWRRAFDYTGSVFAGDAQHVYVHQDSFVLARRTLEGFEPMPVTPGPIEMVMASGAQVAVRVRGLEEGIYRFVDGGWQLAAREPQLLALDDDGALLVSDGFAVFLVAPDGTARPLGRDVEPVGPLVGDSLERLFAPTAGTGLLRFTGDDWEVVEGTAELKVTGLWHAPDGTLFLTTDSDVYRLDDDGLAPLGAPAGRAAGLVGRSATEVYLGSVDETETGTFYRMHRWDGSTWTQLDGLTLEIGDESPGAPRLFGSRGFLLTTRGVSAPDIDPVIYWRAHVSTGEGWTRMSSFNEIEVDDIDSVQMGTAESPSAVLLIDAGDEVRYQIPDEDVPGEIAQEGTLDREFLGGIAGIDLSHMVGVVETDGTAEFVVRDGDDSRQIGAGQLQHGAVFASGAWYGADAVGAASSGGVSLCLR